MITLVGNKVACAPIREPESLGRIYIPDTARSRVKQGVVKYLGSKCKHLKIGDHVLFGAYTGTLILLEDEGSLIIIPEQYAECIIHDETLTVPGLYFKDKDDEYFPVTYETAIGICANSLAHHAQELNVRRIKEGEFTPALVDDDDD